MKKPYMYIVGSMEGRTFEDVQIEHDMIGKNFKKLGYSVLDPLKKENHKKGTILDIDNCGVTPRSVFAMDIECVEKSSLIYWCTADIKSEGSEVEFAVAGWITNNQWRFKKIGAKLIPPKRMIMIGKKRASGELNHFQNMWPGVEIYATHEEFFKQESAGYEI